MGMAHSVLHRRTRGRGRCLSATRPQETLSEEAMHRKEAGSLTALLRHKRALHPSTCFHDGWLSLFLYL